MPLIHSYVEIHVFIQLSEDDAKLNVSCLLSVH